MLTNRLLKLTVAAGIAVTSMPGLSLKAADMPVTTGVAQQGPTATSKRPLTAKEVWGHDYAQARRQAKKLNRPVLLHFHATWCGPCQQMERDVLNSARVLNELNARCVAIKVDCDQNPTLVQQFGVE